MADKTRLEIDRIISILKNDQQLNSLLVTYKITLDDVQYRNLANLFLDNGDKLRSVTIPELIAESPPFLRIEIAETIELNSIGLSLYKQFLYTFKYASLRNFFRDNYHNFLPDYEVLNIQSKEKVKILQEAFMQEFDRFAFIIDKIYDLNDVNSIPKEYLNYMAQTVGYEREDRELLGDASFRELIKNIIEVYQIKGTNFSFELFFSFLGFEAEVIEYWFDKRFSDPGISANVYTAENSPNSHRYYLTPFKPTRYIPEGMVAPYVVTEDQIIGTLDCNEFDRMINSAEYTLEQLLGKSIGYQETNFTFFKTNIMEYNLSSIYQSDSIGGEEGEEGGLTAEQLIIVNRYAEFLTPIFIAKNVRITVGELDSSGSPFIVTDNRRPGPRSNNYRNVNSDIPGVDPVNGERMFHLYQGFFPSEFYWDDGVRRYQDPIPYPDGQNERWSGNKIEPGGHFISGYFLNNYNKIWNKTISSNSVYDYLKTFNSWTEQETKEYMSDLIGRSGILSKYKKEKLENGIDWNDKTIWEVPATATQFKNESLAIIDLVTDASAAYTEVESQPLDWWSGLSAGMLEKTILEEVERRVNAGYYANVDEIFVRDLIYPYFDEEVEYPFISFENKDLFQGTKKTLGHFGEDAKLQKGNKYRLSNNNSAFSSSELYNKASILSITSDNGNGQAEITIADNKRKFNFFKGPMTMADPWKPRNYTQNYLARGENGYIYVCTNAYDGTGDLSLEDSIENWQVLPNEFDKFKRNKISGIFGNLTTGSKKITNVRFSYEKAPFWSPDNYKEDDLRRDSSGNVFICINAYDGTGDSNLEDNLNSWSSLSATDALQVGMKIYNDDLLFQAKIMKIDRAQRSITLDLPSPVTKQTNNLYFLKEDKILIQIRGAYNYQNNGIFKVVEASSEIVSRQIEKGEFYKIETILVLDETLKYDQSSEFGFIELFAEDWKLRNPRYPLFFNVLDVKGYRNGLKLELPYEPNAVEAVEGSLQPTFGIDIDTDGSVSETDIELE